MMEFTMRQTKQLDDIYSAAEALCQTLAPDYGDTAFHLEMADLIARNLVDAGFEVEFPWRDGKGEIHDFY